MPNPPTEYPCAFSLPISPANTAQLFSFDVHQGGWLVGIVPTKVGGTDAPPGRYYARVSVPAQAPNQRLNVWTGKISGSEVMSVPNVYIGAGTTIYITVFCGSNAVANDPFELRLYLSLDQPLGGAFLFHENAFDGPGEIISTILTQPAAGADYAVQTVPAFVRWKLKGLNGSLTTAIAVANRLPVLKKDSGAAAGTFQADPGPLYQVASITVMYSWGLGGGEILPLSGLLAVTNVTLSNATIPTGFRFLLATTNIQAADQWSAGAYSLEEWAGPQP